MASRETEFFENIGGVKSYTVDVFRLAGQREIRGLLDDGSGRFGSALSASHQRHQATRPRTLRSSLRFFAAEDKEKLSGFPVAV